MAKGILRKILLPREDKFYPLFENMAELISGAAHKLAGIIEHPDPAGQEDAFREIKILEDQADDIVHSVFDKLDTTFITPFDREDIQALTSRLDDVMDFINAASQQIKLNKPKKLPARFREMNQVGVLGCEQMRIAVLELRNLKKPEKLNEACLKINELENQADEIYHELISELFEFESDAIELIKNKGILETLESAVDRIEDVSDILKTIMIKSA